MKISKIGIEFEGEFIKNPNEFTIEQLRSAPDWKVTTDGSLRERNGGYCKELISTPFAYTDKTKVINQLKMFEDEDKKLTYANNSAGTHIHISFENDVEYCKATQWAIYEKFIKAYKKAFDLPKYNDRLANTEMCTQFYDNKDFMSYVGNQLKARSKDGSRYKVFNYCKSLHGTLEIRIFPYVTTLAGLSNIVDFVYKFFNELKVAHYAPLENIMKFDKLSVACNSVTGSMLENFSSQYTRARNKLYFDVKTLPFDLLKFIYHTTPIGLHKDD